MHFWENNEWNGSLEGQIFGWGYSRQCYLVTQWTFTIPFSVAGFALQRQAGRVVYQSPLQLEMAL